MIQLHQQRPGHKVEVTSPSGDKGRVYVEPIDLTFLAAVDSERLTHQLATLKRVLEAGLDPDAEAVQALLDEGDEGDEGSTRGLRFARLMSDAAMARAMNGTLLVAWEPADFQTEAGPLPWQAEGGGYHADNGLLLLSQPWLRRQVFEASLTLQEGEQREARRAKKGSSRTSRGASASAARRKKSGGGSKPATGATPGK